MRTDSLGLRGHRWLRRWVLLLTLAATLTACVTSQEVERIVGESNAALTAQALLTSTEIPDLTPQDATGLGGEDLATWRTRVGEQRAAAIARIDAFDAAHRDEPGLTRTVHALRLRKALMLTMSGERNLARAAYAAVDRSQVGNARDLALLDAADPLIWWWGVAGKGNVQPAQFEREARSQLATLDDVIGRAPPGSSVRYYLATVRAHVHKKWATTETDPRPLLREGLRAYAVEFDPAAQEGVRRWVAGGAEDLASIDTAKLRWFGQAPITRDEYVRTYREFFDELRTLPQDEIDPALAEELRSGRMGPALDWPAECAWLIDLD